MTGNANNGLPDQVPVKVPLDRFVREIAREAAWTVIDEHTKRSHIGLEQRVARLELRLATFIAFMAGSGLLGGAIGAAVAQVFIGD